MSSDDARQVVSSGCGGCIALLLAGFALIIGIGFLVLLISIFGSMFG